MPPPNHRSQAMSPSMVSSVGPRGVSNFGIFLCKSYRFISNCITSAVSFFTPSLKAKLPPIEEPLLLLPAHQLIKQIKTGRLKCEKVVQVYINRIKQVQPFINAIVDERFDQALEEARLIDRKIEAEIMSGLSADDPSSVCNS